MNHNAPKVTVGLPVFNGENYVRQAIESILNQTYTDFELIVSDNASVDRTPEICLEYAARDPRIRYIRRPENIGGGPNQNCLVAEARGEYFIWLMHDDVYGARLLELCVGVLDSRPDVVVAYPKMIDIDSEGRELGPRNEDTHLMQETPNARVGKCMKHIFIVNATLGAIRTEVLRRTMMIEPWRGSDNALLIELAVLGKIFEVSERLYYRRLHPGASLVANSDPLSIARWFNPGAKKATRHYKLRMYAGYLKAVLRRREIGLWEQLLCLLQLQRWPLQKLRDWLGLRKRRLLRAMHLQPS
jgi:glycosyltransferase involved in cell wall biosynthesis